MAGPCPCGFGPALLLWGLSFPFCRVSALLPTASLPRAPPGSTRSPFPRPLSPQRPRSPGWPSWRRRAGGPALPPPRGISAPSHSPGPRTPLVTQASWKRRGVCVCAGFPATPPRVPATRVSLTAPWATHGGLCLLHCAHPLEGTPSCWHPLLPVSSAGVGTCPASFP